MNIQKQSSFVYDVLINIIYGNEYEEKILSQIALAQIKSYEYTGWGVFIYFDVTTVLKSDKLAAEEMLFGGLLIESTEFNAPYTEALFKIRDGYINYLEIESTSNSYPHKDLTNYKLIKAWQQKGNLQ